MNNTYTHLTTIDESEAVLIKQRLEDVGISCHVIDAVSNMPFGVYGATSLRQKNVYVEIGQKEVAIELLGIE